MHPPNRVLYVAVNACVVFTYYAGMVLGVQHISNGSSCLAPPQSVLSCNQKLHVMQQAMFVCASISTGCQGYDKMRGPLLVAVIHMHQG